MNTKPGYGDATIAQQVRVDELGVLRLQHVPLGCYLFLALHGIHTHVALRGPTVEIPNPVIEYRLTRSSGSKR